MDTGAKDERHSSVGRPGSLPFPAFPVVGAAALAMLTASPAEAQRGGDAQADNCAKVVEVAREARSLEDMKLRFERAGATERELGGCREALHQDALVMSIIQQGLQQFHTLELQEAELARSRFARAPEELAANGRVVESRREGSRRASEVESRRSEPPPPPAPTPAIEFVTPSTIVPGTDLVIEGAGFGSAGGTVRLKLQGKTFSASVNHWADTWISAYLSDNISGVTETTGAVLEIQPQGGAALSRAVPFVPIYESMVVNDLPLVLSVWPFAGEAHTTVAEKMSLGSHWRVVGSPWTTAKGDASCVLDGPPVANASNSNLATRVKLEWGVWALPSCVVYFEIEGPKGFEHGLW
jgi:hypothetical protein